MCMFICVWITFKHNFTHADSMFSGSMWHTFDVLALLLFGGWKTFDRPFYIIIFSLKFYRNLRYFYEILFVEKSYTFLSRVSLWNAIKSLRCQSCIKSYVAESWTFLSNSICWETEYFFIIIFYYSSIKFYLYRTYINILKDFTQIYPSRNPIIFYHQLLIENISNIIHSRLWSNSTYQNLWNFHQLVSI